MEKPQARVTVLVKMPTWRKEKQFLQNTRIWLQPPEHPAPVSYRGMVPGMVQKFSFTRGGFVQAPSSHLIPSAYQTGVYLLLTREAHPKCGKETAVPHQLGLPQTLQIWPLCSFGPLFKTKSSTPSPSCSSKPLA